MSLLQYNLECHHLYFVCGDLTYILPTGQLPKMVFAPKAVVVTGATSKGIGRSLASAIHDLPGHPKVIVTGRQQDKLDELASRSDRIYGRYLDQLSSKENLQRWVLRLLNEHQDIDTVVLNAGIQIPADFSRPDTVDLDAVRNCFTSQDTSPGRWLM